MILLVASLAIACPNVDAEVERATSALIAGDFAAARTALQSAESSFACAPSTPTQIARFWLVEGAAAHLRADTVSARASLAAARATAPTLFDDRLGADVRATWAAAEPLGSGSLMLEPRLAASMDGQEVGAWPVTLSAAPHVLQVIGADGAVRYGRVVRIGPGEDALVETGLAPEPSMGVGTALPPSEPRRKRSPAMVIVASVAAAGAGACAGGALVQNAQMENAADLDTLDAAFDRQKAFGYTSYGLAGAAAAALTLHFIIK
ncbi:MAG: hypothetical protein Q8P18_19405 [Pseudomonadota bacterium]|nr:hypothetical protein [Pseudomonadota bacterium]